MHSLSSGRESPCNSVPVLKFRMFLHALTQQRPRVAMQKFNTVAIQKLLSLTACMLITHNQWDSHTG